MGYKKTQVVQISLTIKECVANGGFMGKMIGLWLLGVPIIVIVILKVFGII